MEDKKSELYRCGKELFEAKGLKDTSVADITAAAGVSVGSFYSFYPSKDQLFLEIFLAENEALKRHMNDSIDPGLGPADAIQQILELNAIGMRTNPILCQWYDKYVYSKLERLFREQDGLDLLHFLYETFLERIRKWQSEGTLRNDIDGEMIMALFTAVINADLHKEEIGLQYFPQVQNWLMEFILNGLTNHKNH